MKSTQLYTCVVHFWYIPTPHLSSQWLKGEKGAPLMKLTTKYLTAKWKQMHSRSLVSNWYLPVICVTYVRIITTLSDV